MKLNVTSLITLLGSVAASAIAAYQPQINSFVDHNTWAVALGGVLVSVINNITTPIHKG
jgi:hypothetical protein